MPRPIAWQLAKHRVIRAELLVGSDLRKVQHVRTDSTGTDLDLTLLGKVLQGEAREQVLLCYGQGDEQDSLQQLQHKLLDDVSERIRGEQSGSGDILLAGNNLLRVANELAEHAECIVWAGDDRRQRDSAHPEIQQQDRAFLDAEFTSRFDLIIIEGTIHYLALLSFLQKARSLLKENGRLMLLGECLARDTVIEFSPLANLESLNGLSQRLGYHPVNQIDWSSGARLTLQKLLQLLDAQTGVDVSSLVAAAKAITQEFDNGRRCFGLFEFCYRPSSDDEWASAEFADIDSFAPADIADLFQKSFNVDFDPEVWDWKYGLGDGRCVVARTGPQGEIVSHYGGAPRKICYFGSPSLAIQVCDVMVLPEVRRNYGRSSLFFRTAATFLEREIGYSVAHLLGFGFPNQKAMNIAIRLGLYEKTDDFLEMICSDESQSSRWQVEEFDLDTQRGSLDQLWMQMRAEFSEGIIGVRDSEYFEYRYLRHPFGKRGQYQCLQITDPEGRLRAVAVLREHGEQNLLMELITVTADMAETVSLLTRWSARRDNPRQLKFWLTRNWIERLQLPALAVNDLGIEIPCNSWNAGPPVQELRDRWWLTAGDMDFL